MLMNDTWGEGAPLSEAEEEEKREKEVLGALGAYGEAVSRMTRADVGPALAGEQDFTRVSDLRRAFRRMRLGADGAGPAHHRDLAAGVRAGEDGLDRVSLDAHSGLSSSTRRPHRRLPIP